jgi:two-component system, LytTR family, sensor kinase
MTARVFFETNGLFLCAGLLGLRRLRGEKPGSTASVSLRTRAGLRRGLPAAALLGAATLLSFFFASQYFIAARHFGSPIPFGKALAAQLVCWYLWAAASPVILWLARRFPIERTLLARRAALQLAAGVAVSGVHGVIEAAVFQAFPLSPRRVSFGERLQGVFVGEFHGDLIAYLVILAAGHAISYYRTYRREELTRSRLEARLAQAELEVLRRQLHPHFLFNTLHAISSLMHRDVEAADRMMSRLGDLLRMSLDLAGKQEVTLKEELEFLERYLEIQQARFQDRFSVGLQIEPATLDARVPYRILQPLVENAVQHGIAPCAGSGRIEIVSRQVDGSLELQVRDTGAGAAGAALPLPEGLGLANTRSRLVHLYGSCHRFDIRKRPGGGIAVTLAIPFRISVQEESYGDPESDVEDPRPDRG